MILEADRFSIYKSYNRFNIVIVGLGGTGSNVARVLAKIHRLIKVIKITNMNVALIDYDIVEESNILRGQEFSMNDIGMNKALITAVRINREYGVDWTYLPEKVEKATHTEKTDIIICCVDSVQARLETYKKFKTETNLYIDCGNSKDSGQILSFMEETFEEYKKIFPSDDLDPYTCNILDKLDQQSLMINNSIANAVGLLLERIFINGYLTVPKRTYVNNQSITMLSQE